MGLRVKVGTPAPLASPGYPPRLQVARGVSPALPHGRVGPPSPARSLALALLRVLLVVLGVPLPGGVRGLLGLAFPRERVGQGHSLPPTCALHPTGGGGGFLPGPQGAVGVYCGGKVGRAQGCQPSRVGIIGAPLLWG